MESGYLLRTAGADRDHLARRFNCPILLARAILLPQDRYQISFYEPIRPTTSEDEKADILRITCAINTAFESWIREHPAQWLCTKRRWPKRHEDQHGPQR
jgi:Kdo2-lipid IVA lauroyltransferase/acyltransferase